MLCVPFLERRIQSSLYKKMALKQQRLSYEAVGKKPANFFRDQTPFAVGNFPKKGEFSAGIPIPKMAETFRLRIYDVNCPR